MKSKFRNKSNNLTFFFEETNELSSHFQSVVNPAFSSKLENVNELPKYEDLSHSNLENTTAATPAVPETTTIVQNEEIQQQQRQENNTESIQMSEINLNSNDIATKNQKETTDDNNNKSNNNSVRTEISQV